MVGLSIGAIEAQTATSVSALRFYERKGLLPRPPRVSGQRRYPPEAVDRVLMIRMWQNAGFRLGEISELLADRHRRDAWQQLVRTKIAELGTRQSEIERARQQLEHALLCQAPDWTTCTWMQAAARTSRPPPTEKAAPSDTVNATRKLRPKRRPTASATLPTDPAVGVCKPPGSL